jgi:hypothetical protein
MGSPRERGGVLALVSGQVRARAGKGRSRRASGGGPGPILVQVGLPQGG